MTCHNCHKPGVRFKTHYSPVRRRPWAVMKCVNPACRFEFKAWESGKTETGKPVWMVPEREQVR